MENDDGCDELRYVHHDYATRRALQHPAIRSEKGVAEVEYAMKAGHHGGRIHHSITL